MKTWLRDNSLTLVLLLLFLGSLIGLALTGLAHENQERLEHGETLFTLGQYMTDASFSSAVFENWESEFLQMLTYVVLTAYAFQRGSPESREPDVPAPQDEFPAASAAPKGAPWPVRAGGLARKLYAHSLGLALAALFVFSFVLHWLNSARMAQDEARQHGEPPPSVLDHLGGSTFWFESFQNWQSEFLSTAVLIVLAIVLREYRSPESKPVAAPHAKTGTD